MKKIKFEGKLNLNKEVVTRLNDAELGSVKGGAKKTKRKKCSNETKVCTVSVVCAIDEDSSPVLCDPDLPDFPTIVTGV